MLLVIIVFVVFFIYGIIAAIRDRDLEYFWLISVLCSLLCGSLALIITAIIGTGISSSEIVYEETVTPIVALEDNTASYGQFFLGTGTSKSDIYYYYMIDTERGYVMQNIKASNAYIKYDANPRIVIENGCGFKHWYNNIWAFPISTRYTIYVPEGTILNNYNIDLK